MATNNQNTAIKSEDAYMVFSGKAKKGFSSYLELAKNILVEKGYSVEIRKEHYFDTEIKKKVHGSILADIDDEIHYHILINGKLPGYENGGESPLMSKPRGKEQMQIIRHKETFALGSFSRGPRTS